MRARPAGSTARIFVSYARADGEEFTRSLRERLEREQPHLTLWQDRARMEGGVGWWRQITDAIDHVELMIMVMTPAAILSEVARKEWRYARQQGVRVCPVMGVPAAQLDIAALPGWMRKAHFYDLDREWPTFIAFLNSPARENRVPFMAPDLRADFVNRPKEFEALLAALLDHDRANPVVITTALQGAGGFGKTTLAVAVCHQDDIITAFDDGILWATLGEAPKVQHEVTKLYAALTGERPSFLDVDDAAIHLAERLEDKNCLVVIDDVWDPNHLLPFLRGGKQCARLITTRRLDVITEAGAHRIAVNEMTADQSIALLTARLPSVPDDRSPFRALAARLGEWPLLLRLAASQLLERIDRGDSLPGALSYVSLALDRRGPVAFDRTSASARSDAVGRTVRASLELLSAEDRSRCAELAIFPDGVTVPSSAVGALWQVDGFEVEEIVQRLDSAALVDFDLKVGAIRMHHVLQMYLRSELQNPREAHARLVITGWPDHYNLPDAYAWRWLSWHLVQAGQHDRLRALLGDYRWLQTKLERLGIQALLADFEVLDDRGDLRVVQDALRLSASALGRDPKQLAAQLTGRLERGHSRAIDALLAEADAVSRRPWLRLRHTSLTHAGGALHGILKGHGGSVEALAMSSDGRLLISGASDWTLRLWDVAGSRLVTTLTGHSGPVLCLAITPNGRTAISGSEDRTIRVWDVEDRRLLSVLRQHMGAVCGLALTPNAQFVASVSEDRTVRLWELATGAEQRLSTSHSHQARAIAWLPDGKHVVFSPGDETVVVLSVADKQVVTTCRGHESLVRAVAVSADGRTIVSGSADRTVRVFDATSGKQTAVFEGHADQVECVAFAKGGRVAVSGSLDGTLRTWDLETVNPLAILEGHASFVRSVAITRNSALLFSGSSDRTIRHWNLEHRTDVARTAARVEPVSLLSLSANGTRALSGSRTSGLSVWDVDRGTVTSRLEGHSTTIRRRSPGIHMSAVVTAISLSEDGSRAVSASRDATLRVWDVISGHTLHGLTGHSDAVLKIAVSANGRQAASLGRDRTVRLWELFDGRSVRVLASEDNTKAVTSQTSDPLLLELGQLTPLDITQSTINRDAEINISHDGRYVVIGDDSGVLCWDVLTGRSLKERFDDFIVVSIAMGLRGRAILGSRTGSIKVWNLERCATEKTWSAHAGQVLDLAVGADQETLISAGRDDSLTVWDLANNTPIGTLAGQSSNVDAVAIAPDGRVAYSIYGDTITASDLVTLTPIGSLSLDHQITVVAVSSDGSSVAVGDESGMVHFATIGDDSRGRSLVLPSNR